jgi:hypothetical protein
MYAYGVGFMPVRCCKAETEAEAEPGVSGRAYGDDGLYVAGTEEYEYCGPGRLAGAVSVADMPNGLTLPDVFWRAPAWRRRRRRHQKTMPTTMARTARQPTMPPVIAPAGELLEVVTLAVEGSAEAELPGAAELGVLETATDETFVT